MSVSPIDRVLERLAHVKKAGGRYQARCPAHDDRTPSLSITETDDGKVLLRCWAGCDTEAVLAAMGLTWRDLFPPRHRSRDRR
ncbi:MAG TPA: CHC2 zinc finger domain-containing protein [Coriobacteriia bacterium]|nr:CHC2 zinc finger domain-containing protein [Coriobacteriia bacterium]